ncbi:MAG: hypothetical protein K9N09_07595 [Candidatus Cloacimonetes bacterium]|nr:hypothetical protein [Candidatus Cloacimonadota bacterium]MCF8357078.1 hypothetical protein [Melioribacteraceae bacterium]
MLTVQILKCQGCGANLSPNNSICEYCKSENIVKTEKDPFKLDKKLTKQYSNYYKCKAKENPTDAEAIYSLGLFYLKLKLYDLAISNFKNAITLTPDEADLYYYYALSLIKGRRIKTLTFKEIKIIEEYLNTAIQLEDKASYYYLSALIKYDYYRANGLMSNGSSYSELITEAKECYSDQDELNVLLENIITNNELLNLINNK